MQATNNLLETWSKHVFVFQLPPSSFLFDVWKISLDAPFSCFITVYLSCLGDIASMIPRLTYVDTSGLHVHRFYTKHTIDPEPQVAHK